MSLFSEYLKELGTKQIVEDEYGFATFYKFNDGLYIEDIFVKKEFRDKGYASKYADIIAQLAKEQDLLKLYGSVRPSANGSTTSMRVLMAYGFKLHSASNDAIIFVKELIWGA